MPVTLLYTLQFSGLGFVSLGPGRWAHFTMPRFNVFMFVFLCYLVKLRMCCIIVTRWGEPGEIEAYNP